MGGTITTRHLLTKAPTIIAEFGVGTYLRCLCKTLLSRREVTFLECVCHLERDTKSSRPSDSAAN